MGPHLPGPLAREAMPLDEAPSARPFLDVGVPAAMWISCCLGLADEIQRAHDPGAGRVRALDELAQPTGRGDRVVVDEHDVAGSDVLEAQVPRLRWGRGTRSVRTRVNPRA